MALAVACAKSPMATDAGPAPQIACPASTTVTSSDGVSALVLYGDPVVTGGQAPFTTNCTPVSGASFPVGSSSVTCRTVDALQRSNSCIFTVTVMRAPTPKIALTSFVAFGDSMTYGEDGRNVATDPLSLFVRPLVQVATPYPLRLQSLLQLRYSSQTMAMTNAGQVGESAEACPSCTVGNGPTCANDAYTRLVTCVLPAAAYQVLLLMEGANDLGNEDGIDAALQGLQRMIDAAKSRGLRVFLATIPPEKQYLADPTINRAHTPESDILTMNSRIRSLAFTEGVPLVDVYQAFPNPDLNDLHALGLISNDGLHLQQAGYDLVASTFFGAIESALEVPSTPAASAAIRRGGAVKSGAIGRK